MFSIVKLRPYSRKKKSSIFQNNLFLSLFPVMCSAGQHFSKLGVHEEENLRNPQQAKSRPLISEVTEDDQKAQLNSQQISASHLQDPQVQAILSDPTNRRILMDPQIQELIQSLRQNPEKANRLLAHLLFEYSF